MLSQVKLFVLAGTHDKFTEDEFKHLKVCEMAIPFDKRIN